MAVALVGGAFLSAFLQVAFDRLASRDFLDFLKGREDIDGSLKKLKMLLMSTDAVLAYAEDNQYTIPAVKEWLDELQDAVYDADDLLDKIALRCKLQAESQTGTSEVRKSITALVNSLDKEILSKLKKILKDLNILIKQMGILSLKKDTVGVKLSSPPSQTKTSCPETCDVIGRDMDKKIIFELLESDVASSDKICVVPIVGMGGIGKTTLAQFVYNDEKVKKNFDYKAWVCVSENFDNLEILKAILERINGSASNLQCLDSLETKIREILKGKKFFVVLDDVWNENWVVWDNFLKVFKCEAQEVKIIVTTRSKVVASKVCTVSTHYCLKTLSNKDCMDIFIHSAFRNRNEFPHLLEIVEEIVEKCRGLPLAAKILGGSLHSNVNQNDWNKIRKNRLWDLLDAKTNIFPTLRLSYHYLPSHLKRCFAYCSIFPKDYKFEKEELILLWMAEGLLQQPKEAKNMELEEIGEEYFNDLVSRSFFQQSSESKSCFLMHDLIHDLAKSICGKFVFLLGESNESNEITKETRHLSYYKVGSYACKEFEIPSKAKGLRTLFIKSYLSSSSSVEDNNIVKMIDLNFFQKFNCLRVLSLHGLCMMELPIGDGNLIHLRYLNIGDTEINCLPDSLCNLYYLQTLILSKYITKLPKDTSKLINLRHLDNSKANMEEMPPQMGKLKNLRKLPVFVVSKHDDGSRIKELGELQHLSGKLSLLILENVQYINKDTTEVILKNKQDLSELELEWKLRHGAKDSQNERILLEQLCPCTNLNYLTIINYEGTSLPKWLGDSSFSKMVSIKLSNCEYCCSLPPLGQLPDLKNLQIECFKNISKVDSDFYGDMDNPFRALKDLSFENMPAWQEWDIKEVFSRLQKLYIKDCPKLSGGLPVQLPSLTELAIRECEQLVASLPNSPALHKLLCTGKIQIPGGHGYQSLRSGRIEFAFLTHLEFCKCPDLVSFPSGGLCAPKLSEIVIKGCINFKSLPEGMHTLQSLVCLVLQLCPELESFPEGGLPPSLETLSINCCKKLISRRMELGLQVLRSLRSFTIADHDKELEAFPEEALLPPNLTDLTIIDLPNLKSFNGKGFERLTTLKKLRIWRCNNLDCLLEDVLPASLCYLQIKHCRLLNERYGNENGEGQVKIADKSIDIS